MLEVEKEVVRKSGTGTPEILFPKQIFDSAWGKDDRIPVRIVFVNENEIRILRKEPKKKDGYENLPFSREELKVLRDVLIEACVTKSKLGESCETEDAILQKLNTILEADQR